MWSPIGCGPTFKRGWRITMPNLEQTGQLRCLRGLDELAADDAKWDDVRPTLAGAEPETRTSSCMCCSTKCGATSVHRVGVPHRGEVRQHQAGQPGMAQGAVGAFRRDGVSTPAPPIAGPRPRSDEQEPARDLYVSGLGLTVAGCAGPTDSHSTINRSSPQTLRHHRSAAASDGQGRHPRQDQGTQPANRLPHPGQPDRMAGRHRRIPGTRPDPRQPGQRPSQPVLPATSTPRPRRHWSVWRPASTPRRSSRPTARSAKSGSATPNYPFCTARRRWNSASTSRA